MKMEASVDPQCRGPDWMPITPKTGSLFHAETQAKSSCEIVAFLQSEESRLFLSAKQISRSMSINLSPARHVALNGACDMLGV
ncbi:MAG TPA: hypothetical protein VNO87_00780, partial [Methylomirabilota bacterium]|nr:hypothetical protein [Methylomirabilota bacterium]